MLHVSFRNEEKKIRQVRVLRCGFLACLAHNATVHVQITVQVDSGSMNLTVGEFKDQLQKRIPRVFKIYDAATIIDDSVGVAWMCQRSASEGKVFFVCQDENEIPGLLPTLDLFLRSVDPSFAFVRSPGSSGSPHWCATSYEPRSCSDCHFMRRCSFDQSSN